MLRDDDHVLREAVTTDAPALLEWRNDPATRMNSRSTDLIDETEHRIWLEASLKNESVSLLILEVAGAGAGTSRWHPVGPDSWEVSLTLAPKFRGQGMSDVLLALSERWLVQQRGSRAITAVAVVHSANSPSRRLFESAGYRVTSGADQDGFISLSKQLEPSPAL